jgi:hypothetical protein
MDIPVSYTGFFVAALLVVAFVVVCLMRPTFIKIAKTRTETLQLFLLIPTSAVRDLCHKRNVVSDDGSDDELADVRTLTCPYAPNFLFHMSTYSHTYFRKLVGYIQNGAAHNGWFVIKYMVPGSTQFVRFTIEHPHTLAGSNTHSQPVARSMAIPCDLG